MNYPKTKNSNIVTQTLNNEVLVYNINNDKIHCLNHSISAVYQACDGNNDIEKMRQLASISLGKTVSNEFVYLSLKELNKNELLENYDSIDNKIQNLSRRSLVKKIGVASLVALPIISALVAPSSVHAGSCSSASCSPTLACCPGLNCNGTNCGTSTVVS